MATVNTTPEVNLITQDQMKRVREVDFVSQFTHNALDKLNEVLGVTRKIPVMEGTTLYVYSTNGTLQDGSVAEGEIIPLSQYEEVKTPAGEIELKKWRKAASAEAIKKSGYNAAVVDTDAALLRDIQKSIRNDIFSFLSEYSLERTSSGANLQEALADAWGNLQIVFEDDAIEPVFFVNPMDISEYLGTAQITTQTAFGMTYIENFLGLGTVVIAPKIPVHHYYATAKGNIIMYYLTMNGDLANAFNLTTDETGFVGIKSGYQNEERAQVESLVMSGVTHLVEYSAGVIKGEIVGA